MLRAVFPNGRFSPPATEASVASAEAMLGIWLPESLRQLYFVCDGFREDRGNAKYLFSLMEQDVVGSLVSITNFLWTEIAKPNLRAFVFFGSSSGDEYWGINRLRPNEIISYHHHMEDEYEVVGTDIIEVYREDYARYDELV